MRVVQLNDTETSMFDSTPQTPAASADWRTHISRGDILSFAWPGADAARGPCLMLDRARIGGRPFVLLAAGEPDDGRFARGYDILVERAEARMLAGLAEPTRFRADRRLLVSLDTSGLQLDGGASPVLGRLSGRELDRLDRVRARIHAEADMAADRRARSLEGRRRARLSLALEPVAARPEVSR